MRLIVRLCKVMFIQVIGLVEYQITGNSMAVGTIIFSIGGG